MFSMNGFKINLGHKLIIILIFKVSLVKGRFRGIELREMVGGRLESVEGFKFILN